MTTWAQHLAAAPRRWYGLEHAQLGGRDAGRCYAFISRRERDAWVRDVYTVAGYRQAYPARLARQRTCYTIDGMPL